MINFTLRGHGKYEWSFHYAHGLAETMLNRNYNDYNNYTNGNSNWLPPDLLDCDSSAEHVGFGMIMCLLDGSPATLYRWTSRPMVAHGLVCLNIDRLGMRHAATKLMKKDQWI